MPVDNSVETTGRQVEARMLNRGDVASFRCKKSNAQQRCNIWINQSNGSGQTITEPIKTDGTVHDGEAGENRDEASWHPNHSNGAPWVSWSLIPPPAPSFPSHLSNLRSFCHNWQVSHKPVATGKSDAGCHSQTVRHHTLTFNENDPNRWLAPNTNNCIKPLNKVKRGEHLAFSWATKAATSRGSRNSKQNLCGGSPPWGGDGLNRKTEQQSIHFTRKEPPIAQT